MRVLRRTLPWLLVVAIVGGAAWACVEYPAQARQVFMTGTMIVSVVLMLAANITLVMGGYCFVEDAFGEHALWGLGVLLPPLAGVVLWLGGGWAASWLGVPLLALIGFVAGVAVACICPVVCLVLLILRWRQFRGYAGAVAGSAAYLVGWVALMAYVVAPASAAAPNPALQRTAASSAAPRGEVPEGRGR
jgi:hypothetical protein